MTTTSAIPTPGAPAEGLPGAAGGWVAGGVAGGGAAGVCAQVTDALKARAKQIASEARVLDVMVSLLVLGSCRRRLTAVARPAGFHVLVELAGAMKPFEHELH